MNELQELRNKVERLKGKRMQLSASLLLTQAGLEENKRSLRRHEQAREIVREVGLKTQKQLQYHISDITSLALEAVFPEPYELVIEFIQRRNKTECDIAFQRKGNKVKPLEAVGVGAVDVATFSLRIASWSMNEIKSANVIILDEPFKYLSSDYQEKASLMIKEISKKLEIQFIIVTHVPMLANYSDRIFEVKQSKRTGKSKVTQS
jgi:DNA repair exonuclease SbcCD ATPase subunit